MRFQGQGDQQYPRYRFSTVQIQQTDISEQLWGGVKRQHLFQWHTLAQSVFESWVNSSTARGRRTEQLWSWRTKGTQIQRKRNAKKQPGLERTIERVSTGRPSRKKASKTQANNRTNRKQATRRKANWKLEVIHCGDWNQNQDQDLEQQQQQQQEQPQDKGYPSSPQIQQGPRNSQL